MPKAASRGSAGIERLSMCAGRSPGGDGGGNTGKLPQELEMMKEKDAERWGYQAFGWTGIRNGKCR